MAHKSNNPEEELEKAPFFGSWKAIYIAVLAIFLITVGLFYLFTVSYS